MSKHTAANREVALTLAAHGISIFPAVVKGQGSKWAKIPLVANWQDAATTDDRKIIEWWVQFPHAVPGIELNRAGLVVIDADRHGDGPDGVAALQELAARYQSEGGLPAGPLSLTAGGGQHHIYRQPNGEQPLGNRRGSLPPGIDVRGRGGWIVAQGSVRPDGNSWRPAPTTSSLAAAYKLGTIPTIPAWLVTLIRSSRPESRANGSPAQASSSTANREAAYARQALHRTAQDLARTPSGGRNEALNGSAFRMGRMVARGWIDMTEVVDQLSEAAIQSGLDVDEVQKTLASGLTAGTQTPAEDLPDRPHDHRNGHAQDFSSNAPHDGDAKAKAKAWPDPVPLPHSLRPVSPFDYDMLPKRMGPWVSDVCGRMQCPPDYVAIGVMAALGSIIGRRVAIRPQREDDWSVVPNQWALGIGRPGVMKSPAMEEALRPLKLLAAAARDRFNLEKAEYDVKLAAAKVRSKDAEKKAVQAVAKDKNAAIDDLLKPPVIEDEPTLKRYIATNASVEALGDLLRQNPNGLLVHRDEMLSLLDRLDEEGHADERGFYLTGWSGNSAYTFDRIGRGLDLHVDAVCLSMLGGTQPGRISQYLVHVRRGGRGDDGLIQRFGLLVWPDVPATWTNVDRKPDREARDAAFQAFQVLDELDWRGIGGKRDLGPTGDAEGVPYLRLSEEANALFVGWRTELERRLRQDGLHPALESHLAKYRKLVPGLALIIHLADGGTGEVSRAAVEKALRWAAYLETHAVRTYASTAIASADAARAIVAKIKSGHLKEQFGSREVWRPQWSLLTDRDTVHAALELLVDYDWLSVATVKTPGRTATVYTVNPKVLAS